MTIRSTTMPVYVLFFRIHVMRGICQGMTRIGRFVVSGGMILLFLLAATYGGYHFQKQKYLNPTTLTFRKPPDHNQSRQDTIKLVPMYPTETNPAPVFRGSFWASPQLIQLPKQPPFLLLVASKGAVAAIDLPAGRRLWQTELRQSSDEEILARAAPAQLGDNVLIVYQVTSQKTGATEHRGVVLNLRDGKINRHFPTLVFNANLPATEGEKVKFDAEWHQARGVSIVPSPEGLGRAYVTFGGKNDQYAWHGWLFEVDLDRWQRSAKEAISAVFVATPETRCDDGTNGKICGGGMWAYAGPVIYQGTGGPEIFVQTGNGRLDLSRNDFSQSLLRVSPGLKFAPECNAQVCAASNPRDPAPACLATCKNLFIPRLLPSDAPLDPPGGDCRNKTYLECLELMDWDFGSSSPVRVQVRGHPYFVTTGKSGDVFLIDGEVLGVMYDRKRAAAMCGTPTTPCPSPYDGLVITQTAATTIEDKPLVVVATYNIDRANPAGVVAYWVVGTPSEPRLEEAWRVPSPSSSQARTWFRAPPTRPIISSIAEEQVVWIVDNDAAGHILAIRARDGRILADARSAGWPMRNSLPVIFNNVLYLPSGVLGREDISWIEAFRITPAW
ncbi:hypothetical protein ACVW16_005365 [Bradyrhizobium sp. USDA 4474]